MRGNAVGPKYIPNVIRYSCKLKLRKKYSCVKGVLNFSHLCKECHSVLCINSSADEDNSDYHKTI